MKVFPVLPKRFNTRTSMYMITSRVVEELRDELNIPIALVDPWIPEQVVLNLGISTKFGFLGYRLSLMDKADVVYFVEGWQKIKVCIVEYLWAIKTGKKIILENGSDPSVVKLISEIQSVVDNVKV